MNPEAHPDFYLVLAGPKSGPISSRGTIRPWVISSVFLFEAEELVNALGGARIGIATSVLFLLQAGSSGVSAAAIAGFFVVLVTSIVTIWSDVATRNKQITTISARSLS